MEIIKKRGMFMVPAFSYPGNDSIIHYNKSFFVTNEISIKEFRPFLNYLMKNGDEVSLFIKYELNNRKIVSTTNKKLYKNIISYSPNKIEETDSSYYFNKTNENLPITGLSREQISYYLYWLESDTINRNSLRQNFKKNDILSFRLMSLNEYKALKYFVKKENVNDQEILNKQLCNLNSGYAELLMNKSQTLMANRYDSIVEINDTIRLPNLGFRIVVNNNNFEKMEHEKCSTVF